MLCHVLRSLAKAWSRVWLQAVLLHAVRVLLPVVPTFERLVRLVRLVLVPWLTNFPGRKGVHVARVLLQVREVRVLILLVLALGQIFEVLLLVPV
jgi:hypothetical protein